jgi:cyclopropane fatty-acyl-phospholipid synthase-like methyltransferase
MSDTIQVGVMRNFSESCERNKEPILQVLKVELAAARSVLEIGSGSGQHALFLAENLPHLQWQPSERAALVEDLRLNLVDSALTNLSEPLELDVRQMPWPQVKVSAVFSANTLHIMAIEAVAQFFAGVGSVLRTGGKLCVYGPFRYQGEFTTESNAAFDRSLKEADPQRGLRDFELLDQWANQQGMQLLKDHQMPSNNQLLVWQKQ